MPQHYEIVGPFDVHRVIVDGREVPFLDAMPANGYGEHVRIHGPDADHAEATFETMTGAGFVVWQDGRRYIVLVAHESAVPLMTYEPRPAAEAGS